jgi:hypothetical protein
VAEPIQAFRTTTPIMRAASVTSPSPAYGTAATSSRIVGAATWLTGIRHALSSGPPSSSLGPSRPRPWWPVRRGVDHPSSRRLPPTASDYRELIGQPGLNGAGPRRRRDVEDRSSRSERDDPEVNATRTGTPRADSPPSAVSFVVVETERLHAQDGKDSMSETPRTRTGRRCSPASGPPTSSGRLSRRRWPSVGPSAAARRASLRGSGT